MRRNVLKPLVDVGYVAFVYGGTEQGKLLCNHKLIDRIHLTGSAKTYDAIVWDGKPKVSAEDEAKSAMIGSYPTTGVFMIRRGFQGKRERRVVLPGSFTLWLLQQPGLFGEQSAAILRTPHVSL